MCIWMFSITLSHFERITWNFFLCMIGAIKFFGKNNFIFTFVGLVTWGWLHIWGGIRKNKMSKDEHEFFSKKLGWIMSPSITCTTHAYLINLICWKKMTKWLETICKKLNSLNKWSLNLLIFNVSKLLNHKHYLDDDGDNNQYMMTTYLLYRLMMKFWFHKSMLFCARLILLNFQKFETWMWEQRHVWASLSHGVFVGI
jgi:hypothetical protein